MDDYIRSLELSFRYREPVMRSAISAMHFASGNKGIDIGCGIGNVTAILAESVAPSGHVTGVDLSPEMIVYARNAAEKAGLSRHITYQLGDMNTLPFDDDVFDWAWSVDCVGYSPVDPLPVIRELVRVVKHGGRITFMAWSSQQLLPGYPTLEARLNATPMGISPFIPGRNPKKHFSRALGWLQTLSLDPPEVHTFAGTIQAPLDDRQREAVLSLIEMRWPAVQAALCDEDWKTFQRLTHPESDEFILNIPDYYAFFTYTLFSARVPG